MDKTPTTIPLTAAFTKLAAEFGLPPELLASRILAAFVRTPPERVVIERRPKGAKGVTTL